MSAAEAAHRPAHRGRSVGLWLAFFLLIGAGIGLAWLGAGSLRPEVSQSGLEFRTVKEGTGEPIGPADAALFDYVLSDDDGRVFDRSDEHNQPAIFTMGGVYPGFAEAMARMKEGGEYRFSIPERIAWAKNAAPSDWPTGSRLTFDVRVRKIARGGAAMMPPAGRPQQ